MPTVRPNHRHRKVKQAWADPHETKNANKEQTRAPRAETSQVTTEDKKQELTANQKQEQEKLQKFKKLASKKVFSKIIINQNYKNFII